jgi:hypothetical protein
MTFDEFSNKLKEIKEEFLKVKKNEIVTVKQLEDYLVERKLRRRSVGLRSLRGLKL